jgi:hypothetical protein
MVMLNKEKSHHIEDGMITKLMVEKKNKQIQKKNSNPIFHYPEMGQDYL